MAYKKVDEVFWTDPEVQCLQPNEKLLFLYLITNPHTHYSGIYYLPTSFILEETGIQGNPIKKALTTLEGGNFIEYDSQKKIVWVKQMAKHQVSQGNTKNILLGIANHLEKLHKSFLIKDFLDYYKYLGIPIENPSKWDAEPIPESVAVEEAVKEEGEEKKKPPSKISFGEHENVKMTKGEYEKLKEITAPNHLGNYIEKLSDYIASKGKKYTSHYAVLRTWLRNDNLLKVDRKKAIPKKPEPEQKLTAADHKAKDTAMKKIKSLGGGIGRLEERG